MWCVCVKGVCISWYVCGDQRTTYGSLSFHHGGSGDETQVVRLGGVCLYSLSHLADLTDELGSLKFAFTCTCSPFTPPMVIFRSSILISFIIYLLLSSQAHGTTCNSLNISFISLPLAFCPVIPWANILIWSWGPILLVALRRCRVLKLEMISGPFNFSSAW